ncbi:MAG: hypothetical protein ABSG11_17885 [Candidatus Korobacteraceae bacterium]|jgi:hypothetical protein
MKPTAPNKKQPAKLRGMSARKKKVKLARQPLTPPNFPVKPQDVF